MQSFSRITNPIFLYAPNTGKGEGGFSEEGFPNRLGDKNVNDGFVDATLHDGHQLLICPRPREWEAFEHPAKNIKAWKTDDRDCHHTLMLASGAFKGESLEEVAASPILRLTNNHNALINSVNICHLKTPSDQIGIQLTYAAYLPDDLVVLSCDFIIQQDERWYSANFVAEGFGPKLAPHSKTFTEEYWSCLKGFRVGGILDGIN